MTIAIEDTQISEAFKAADSPRAALGYGGLTDFAYSDIEEVVAYDELPGDYAEMDVVAILRLRDGRHAMIRAWCDTTGWDCQGGGDIEVAADLASLERLCLTDGERHRLGVATVQT